MAIPGLVRGKMAETVLATLNAKYPHSAFGLRYLFANMGPLQACTTLCEFTIQQAPLEIVEALLGEAPQIIGLGVYIWNVEQTTAVVSLLKRLRPEIVIVLGGPEVSFVDDAPAVCDLADYVITGEGDLAFATLCRELQSGKRPINKWIHPPTPNLAEIKLPYELYSDDDLTHRVLYVEASRGCPFTCEFCLSALDIPVRQFPLEPFLAAMQRLLDRGAKTFKFVDRTFNLNLRVSRAILEFFRERFSPGMFLHFEMIPDRFPEALRELVAEFPPGAIQFEVGIQTWNDDVAVLISRKQDNAAAEDNLRWLRDHTGVHVHADLIIGLPGEDRDSFATGFDRLVALGPQEIQVGILKRLRGTPIIRHDAEFHMIYSAEPPYEILQTRDIDFPTMQSLKRFAKTWDLIANSGNFVETTPWFWQASGSPFAGIMQFSDWLHREVGRTHGIALPRLLELVFRYLTTSAAADPQQLASTILRDYRRGGRSDTPLCLRPFLTAESNRNGPLVTASLPQRQRRHTST